MHPDSQLHMKLPDRLQKHGGLLIGKTHLLL